MWTKIKQLTSGERGLITWGLMPLVIITGLFGAIQEYKLSVLDVSDVDYRHGTIESIEKDFSGYRERPRYKIKLKDFNQVFYIKNVMIERVENLQLVSKNKVSDIYFIPDEDENDIVSMKVDSIDILTISKFNDHYKNTLLITVIGTGTFLIWFGFRVLKGRR
ncbi:MAG: hypothetical protein HYZ44_17870 [Bacteroidetes bacterium]|nr:hypothetical protein [Bacteroidota bacterium]